MCSTPNLNAVQSNNRATWGCPACTVRNPIGSPVCQVCGTPNLDHDQMIEPWECENCCIINRSVYCRSCDSRAPSLDPSDAGIAGIST